MLEEDCWNSRSPTVGHFLYRNHVSIAHLSKKSPAVPNPTIGLLFSGCSLREANIVFLRLHSAVNRRYKCVDCSRQNREQDFDLTIFKKTLSKQSFQKWLSSLLYASRDATSSHASRMPKYFLHNEKIEITLKQFFEKIQLWNDFLQKRRASSCRTRGGGPKPPTYPLNS